MALEAEIGAGFDWTHGVPITTCQRYEIVALDGDEPVAAPQSYAGFDALLHLARLAAGLESLVLGEGEVLGQVRRAFNAAGHDLRRVVAPAIAAARVLRREVDFDTHAGHALDIVLRYAGLSAGGGLVVVGGGPMGRRVAERASELGFDVTLVARRPPPLPAGVRYQPFSRLASLPPTDVLVSCLGRRAPLMCEDQLPAVRRLAIDLATPRNLRDLPVPLVLLADLLDAPASSEEAARRERLDERLRDLLTTQVEMRSSGSHLGVLRDEVERIRQRELARSLRLHPELPPEKLDAITRSLVNQIFHRPSLRLRHAEDLRLAEAVVALFRPATREGADDGR